MLSLFVHAFLSSSLPFALTYQLKRYYTHINIIALTNAIIIAKVIIAVRHSITLTATSNINIQAANVLQTNTGMQQSTRRESIVTFSSLNCVKCSSVQRITCSRKRTGRDFPECSILFTLFWPGIESRLHNALHRSPHCICVRDGTDRSVYVLEVYEIYPYIENGIMYVVVAIWMHTCEQKKWGKKG